MAEKRLWERAGFIHKATKGYVLVKKTITGKIKVIGKYSEETVNDSIRLMDCTEQFLTAALTRIQNANPSDPNIRIIEKVIEVKRGDKTSTMDLELATIPRTNAGIVRRRISAKLGIHLRWPGQAIMAIPTGTIQINTPATHVDLKDYGRVSFDLDYYLTIIDPDAYVTAFNSAAIDHKMDKAAEYINRVIGEELDSIARQCIRAVGVDAFAATDAEVLKRAFNAKLTDIGLRFGVEITGFRLNHLDLPKQVLEAQEAKKAAEARKAARIADAQAQAEEIRLKGDAEAEATKKRGDAEAENDAKKLREKLKVLRRNKKFANLTDKELLEALKTLALAESGKAIFMGEKGSGAQPDLTQLPVFEQLLEAIKGMGAQPATPREPVTPAPLTEEEKKERAKQLATENSLIDRKGYLSFADSCTIADKRGEEQKVYHIDEVTLEEIEELVAFYKAEEEQKGTGQK